MTDRNWVNNAPVTWTKRPAYSFACYDAVINGHRMTVWCFEPGDWRVELKVGSRAVEVDCLSRIHLAKRRAIAWAVNTDPAEVKLERRLRFGRMVWALADAEATQAVGRCQRMEG